jgi:tetratricopeptide (TPR) repeat protein
MTPGTEKIFDWRFGIADLSLRLITFLLLVSAHFLWAQSPLEDALSAIERGDYGRAEQILSTNPQPLLQGILQFHRGDYVSAEKSLIQALERNDDFRARAFLALTRAATGGCDTARPALEEAFRAEGARELRRLSGLALSQCHIAASRFSDAFSVIENLKSFSPEDADVLYQSARLHLKAWNDAVFLMFQKTPASFRVNQLSAEIFEIQGKYSEAVAEFRKAIEKNPAALNLHFRLGRALLMESHSAASLDAARQEFENELKLNPSDAAAEYQIGQILLAQQKPEEAKKRYERAVALNPKFGEALLALGKLRLDEKRFPESIALLQQAADLLPKSEAVHYALMIAYRNSGKTEEALRAKEALEKLQRPPEGEFTDFLKKLGEGSAKSKE